MTDYVHKDLVSFLFPFTQKDYIFYIIDGKGSLRSDNGFHTSHSRQVLEV